MYRQVRISQGAGESLLKHWKDWSDSNRRLWSICVIALCSLFLWISLSPGVSDATRILASILVILTMVVGVTIAALAFRSSLRRKNGGGDDRA
jgi:hypothetical protein